MSPTETVLHFLERINERDADRVAEAMGENHVFVDALGTEIRARHGDSRSGTEIRGREKMRGVARVFQDVSGLPGLA